MTAPTRERMSSLIDGLRVLQHRLGGGPDAVFQALEKAAVPAGVAGDAGGVAELGDGQQQHVVVAVHPDAVHLLEVAALLALVPELAA
mmetsp:Transcript_40887/g.52705  ORF Transcript_40887/g.52705 Transcript_40887/m.52705 type:complete len:88 (-) Transcript_40887:97-360(-)